MFAVRICRLVRKAREWNKDSPSGCVPSGLPPKRRIFRLFAPPPVNRELTRPRSCLENDRYSGSFERGKIYAGRDFMTLAAEPERRRAYLSRFFSTNESPFARDARPSPLMLDSPMLYRPDRRYELGGTHYGVE